VNTNSEQKRVSSAGTVKMTRACVKNGGLDGQFSDRLCCTKEMQKKMLLQNMIQAEML
jgi:hypothetical protein